jgi:predicted RNA-binding protein Jag
VARLSARVSSEAKRGWDEFCETHGVSFSAMVEASGLLIGDHGEALQNIQVIDLARKIDRERLRRG